MNPAEFCYCTGDISQLILLVQLQKAQTRSRAVCAEHPARLCSGAGATKHKLGGCAGARLRRPGRLPPLQRLRPRCGSPAQELAEPAADRRVSQPDAGRILRPRVADPGENPQRVNRGREVPAAGKAAGCAVGAARPTGNVGLFYCSRLVYAIMYYLG